ncbi:distal tail protein Dit [Gordonibacter sp.]|uniref:distal tail protein Dit n=1 Tax=Gordonibacter sp. TaxID=1968902 RepID=UPI002FCBC888
MIFDGTDLAAYMRTSVCRPLMPSPDVGTVSVPGKDGFEVSHVRIKSFEVPVKCLIQPHSPLTVAEGVIAADELKHRIAALLFRREKRPLVFDSDPTRYCMAIVTGVSDIKRTAYVDECTVTFLCEPVFYGPLLERTISSGSNGLSIGGTEPTWPTVEVVAASAVSSIAVTDEASGEFVRVDASYAKGTVLRLDMAAKRATLNGADAAVVITSDFWRLSPGRCSVKLSSGSGTIRYREAWL